jgi:hypothetical protein
MSTLRSARYREGYTSVLNRAKFSSQALKILCDEVYGKLTLAQCPSFVLLPSLLLDNHAPDPLQRACENRYYHNLPKRNDDRERRRRAVSFNTLRQRQKREQERIEREARERATLPLSPSLARKVSSEFDSREEQQQRPPSSPFFEIKAKPASSASTSESNETGGDKSVNEMLDETASDLVMRTIAAPTYFPSYQQHVDGVRGATPCRVYRSLTSPAVVFFRGCLLTIRRLQP